MISVVHGGFIAVYMLWILPIILTTIYAKIRLTTVTTLVSLFAHEISAFYIQWNPEKITDMLYPVNITLFLFLTICVYAISVVIIKWEEKKQDAVLEKEMERQTLRRQIRRDHLTGLYNRMGLREQITRFDEENVEQYYFAMLDVDRFKMVNDTLGHDVGDRILQLLGQILLSMETESFVPFRYGGDEFSIMAYGISLEELVERCKEIQRKYEGNLPEEIREKGCSISVGIAQSIKGSAPSDVIKDADFALYQTKYTQKGGILIYQSKTEQC